MKKVNRIRSRHLRVMLTEEERKRVLQLYSKVQAGSLSEYVRDVLLGEPVTITYRNQSADDFLEEMILLKNELNAIGNNFNQAVQKLHSLDHIAEIRTWVMWYEATGKVFMGKAEEIKGKLQQIYELWLQK